jgi:hypothetical protein
LRVDTVLCLINLLSESFTHAKLRVLLYRETIFMDVLLQSR